CLLQLAREVLNRLVVARGLGSLIGLFDFLFFANREDFEYGKRDRECPRPIGAVRPQSLSSAKEFSGWIHPAAAPHDDRLKIELRIIGAVEPMHERLRLLNTRPLRFGGWIRRYGSRPRRAHRRSSEQNALPNVDVLVRNAKKVRQSRPVYLLLLPRPGEIRPGPGQLGIGAGGIRAGAELIVHKNVHRLRE